MEVPRQTGLSKGSFASGVIANINLYRKLDSNMEDQYRASHWDLNIINQKIASFLDIAYDVYVKDNVYYIAIRAKVCYSYNVDIKF